MSEFTIEDLDAVIAQGREGSLAQMLALQLKSQIRKGEQMAKEREALAVECAAAKIALKYTLSGRRDFILATPETDVFLAGIKADVLPANIAEIIDGGDLETICYESERSYAEWHSTTSASCARGPNERLRYLIKS